LKIREKGLNKKLCGLTLDADYLLFGGESVYKEGRIVDRIRSSNHGYCANTDIGLIYLPLEMSEPGTDLEVEVMGKLVKAKVVSMPIVDPNGKRIRA
jgi:dimethylglycine dehydrogenase